MRIINKILFVILICIICLMQSSVYASAFNDNSKSRLSRFFLMDDGGKKHVNVESVEIISKQKFLGIGQAMQINYRVLPSNATSKAVTFSSSNPKIATVSTTGLVRGISAGQVIITVISVDNKKVKSSITVTIQDIKPLSLNLSASTTELLVGDSIKLTAEVEPSNAVNKKIIFSSSDNSIATVSSTGVILAKKAGNVKISAKIDGTEIEKSIDIKVFDKMSGDSGFETSTTIDVAVTPEVETSIESVLEDITVGSAIIDEYEEFETEVASVISTPIVPQGNVWKYNFQITEAGLSTLNIKAIFNEIGNELPEEEFVRLENELASQIAEAGAGTRGAAVVAARFLAGLDQAILYTGWHPESYSPQIGHYSKVGLSRDWGQSASCSKFRECANPTFGRISHNGLDCNGFVDWVMTNAEISQHGNNTSTYACLSGPNRRTYRLVEAVRGGIIIRPGDIWNEAKDNKNEVGHIGIIVGVDYDNQKVYVAESGANMKYYVCITEYDFSDDTYGKHFITKMDTFYSGDGNFDETPVPEYYIHSN